MSYKNTFLIYETYIVLRHMVLSKDFNWLALGSNLFFFSNFDTYKGTVEHHSLLNRCTEIALS